MTKKIYKSLTRRELLKLSKISAIYVFGAGIINSCSRETDETSPTYTSTPKPTKKPTQEATPSPTKEPKQTATPEMLKYNQEAAIKVRDIMENYGQVDEKYLSLGYWKKMDERIDTYGPAKRILALEYHGDDYSFFGGSYSMTPEQFEEQMTYLCENDYHFVTGPEIVGYLEGWLELPSRSVILTTDSGNTSYKSFPRIISLFSDLEQEYDCYPHMFSTIWTNQMGEGESILCVDDGCWEMFRQVVDSGFFTLGSHTESHADFGDMTEEQTMKDIVQSKEEIKEALGLNVYGITWPLEVCSPHLQALKDEGFIFGYGGRSRGFDYCFTYKQDNIPFCLPRLFPPNPNGLSGRPDGMTFEEMFDYAIKKYEPLQ